MTSRAPGATAIARALAAIILVSPGQGSAQEAWQPPTWVDGSVRALVAEAWSVEQDAVVLEWGPPPVGRSLPEHAPLDPDAGPTPIAEQVQLAGAGVRGAWVVRLPDEGGTFGVRVRAGVRGPRAVAARTIERGETLTEADIATEETVSWGRPDHRTPEAVPGWRAERRIERGSALREPSVRPALVVRTGERVRVVWRSGRVALTLTGVAMGTARPGESVTVRLDAGRRLRGEADADGVVWIRGG